MTPPPVAVGLTVCDYVIVEEKTKKVSLVGAFTGIKVDSFPAVAQPFSVFAVLTDGVGDVTIELTLLRLDTDEESILLRSPFRFPDRLTEVRFHARLRHCQFPAPGQYQFTLAVDGAWVAQKRVRVYSAEDES